MYYEFEVTSKDSTLEVNDFYNYLNCGDYENLTIYNNPDDPAEDVVLNFPHNIQQDQINDILSAIEFHGQQANIIVNYDSLAEANSSNFTLHNQIYIIKSLHDFANEVSTDNLQNSHCKFLQNIENSYELNHDNLILPESFAGKLKELILGADNYSDTEAVSYASKILLKASNNNPSILGWFESNLDNLDINIKQNALEKLSESYRYSIISPENFKNSIFSLDSNINTLASKILIDHARIHKNSFSNEFLTEIIEETNKLLANYPEDSGNNITNNLLLLTDAVKGGRYLSDTHGLAKLLSYSHSGECSNLILEIIYKHTGRDYPLLAETLNLIQDKFLTQGYEESSGLLDKFLLIIENEAKAHSFTPKETISERLAELWLEYSKQANNRHDSDYWQVVCGKIYKFFENNLYSNNEFRTQAKEFFSSNLKQLSANSSEHAKLINSLESLVCNFGESLDSEALTKLEEIIFNQNTSETIKHKALGLLKQALATSNAHPALESMENQIQSLQTLSEELQNSFVSYYIFAGLLYGPDNCVDAIDFITDENLSGQNSPAYYKLAKFRDILNSREQDLESKVSSIINLLLENNQQYSLKLIHRNIYKLMQLQNSEEDVEALEYSSLILKELTSKGISIDNLEYKFLTRIFREFEFSDELMENILNIFINTLNLGGNFSKEEMQNLLEETNAYELCTELCDKIEELLEHNSSNSFAEKNLDTLLEELQNLNQNSELEITRDDDYLNTILTSYKEKLHSSSSIIEGSKAIIDWDTEDLKQWAKKVKNLSGSAWKKNLAEILAGISQAGILHSGNMPRDIQIIAAINLLTSNDNDRPLMQEIATGEGKSLIIAMSAALLALRGKKVDVITSSSVLAQRDCEAWNDFFSSLNLSCGHNSTDALAGNNQSKESSVIYGDVSSFQFSLLNNKFSENSSHQEKNKHVAIVDEVDSMLIDEGCKLAMIASNVSGAEYLNVTLACIWNKIISELSRIVGDTLIIGEFKINYDQNGEKQIELLDPENGKKIPLLDKKLHIVESTLETIQKSFEEKIKHITPKYLWNFVRDNLETWVYSAVTAVNMKENRDYVIDFENGKKHIKPVDYRNTGVIQASSKWGSGLHQFLQLKHKLPLSPETLLTKYISNLSFFKKYGSNIFGMTGTLGSESSKELLKEYYDTDFAYLPTYKPKQFKEEEGELLSSESEWLDKITNIASETKNTERASLIICESISKVYSVKTHLTKNNYPENQIRVYSRNDTDEVKAVGDTLNPGDIIIATNLAGRGTDIKPSNQVLSAGGVHVCVTFLPNNLRVELQSFGRTARSGEPGTAQLVLNSREVASKLDAESFSSLEEVKTLRDEKEKLTVKQAKLYGVPDSLLNDKLFNSFYNTYKKLNSISSPENRTSKRDNKHDYVLNMDDNWGESFSSSKPYKRSEDFVNYKLNQLQELYGFKLNSIKTQISTTNERELQKFFLTYKFKPESSNYEVDSLFQAVKKQAGCKASINEIKNLTLKNIASNDLYSELSESNDDAKIPAPGITDETIFKVIASIYCRNIFVLTYDPQSHVRTETNEQSQEELNKLLNPEILANEGKAKIISVEGSNGLMTFGKKLATKFSPAQYYSLSPLYEDLNEKLNHQIEISFNLPTIEKLPNIISHDTGEYDEQLGELEEKYEQDDYLIARKINANKLEYADKTLKKYLDKQAKAFLDAERIFQNPVYLIREAKKGYDYSDPGYSIKLLSYAANLDNNFAAGALNELAKIFIKRGVTAAERFSYGANNDYEHKVSEFMEKTLKSLNAIETNIECTQIFTGELDNTKDQGLEGQNKDKLSVIKLYKDHIGKALEIMNIKLKKTDPDSKKSSYLSKKEIDKFKKKTSKNNEPLIKSSKWLFDMVSDLNYPDDIATEFHNFGLDGVYDIDVEMGSYAILGATLKLSGALMQIGVGSMLTYAGCSPLARTLLENGFMDILSGIKVLADYEEFDHKQYISEKSMQAASTILSNFMIYKFGEGLDMLCNTPQSLASAKEQSGLNNLLNNCASAGASLTMNISSQAGAEYYCQNSKEDFRQSVKTKLSGALNKAFSESSHEIHELLSRDYFNADSANSSKIITELQNLVESGDNQFYNVVLSLASQAGVNFLNQTKLSVTTSILEIESSIIKSTLNRSEIDKELENLHKNVKETIRELAENSENLKELLSKNLQPVMTSRELDSVIETLKKHEVIYDSIEVDMNKLTSETRDSSLESNNNDNSYFMDNISLGEELEADKSLKSRISELLTSLNNARAQNYDQEAKNIRTKISEQLIELYINKAARKIYGEIYREIGSQASKKLSQEISEISKVGISEYVKDKGENLSQLPVDCKKFFKNMSNNNNLMHHMTLSKSENSGINAGDKQTRELDSSKGSVFNNFFDKQANKQAIQQKYDINEAGYSLAEAITLGMDNFSEGKNKESLKLIEYKRKEQLRRLTNAMFGTPDIENVIMSKYFEGLDKYFNKEIDSLIHYDFNQISQTGQNERYNYSNSPDDLSEDQLTSSINEQLLPPEDAGLSGYLPDADELSSGILPGIRSGIFGNSQQTNLLSDMHIFGPEIGGDPNKSFTEKLIEHKAGKSIVINNSNRNNNLKNDKITDKIKKSFINITREIWRNEVFKRDYKLMKPIYYDKLGPKIKLDPTNSIKFVRSLRKEFKISQLWENMKHQKSINKIEFGGNLLYHQRLDLLEATFEHSPVKKYSIAGPEFYLQTQALISNSGSRFNLAGGLRLCSIYTNINLLSFATFNNKYVINFDGRIGIGYTADNMLSLFKNLKNISFGRGSNINNSNIFHFWGINLDIYGKDHWDDVNEIIGLYFPPLHNIEDVFIRHRWAVATKIK